MIGYEIGLAVAAFFIASDWLLQRPVKKRRIAEYRKQHGHS